MMPQPQTARPFPLSSQYFSQVYKSIHATKGVIVIGQVLYGETETLFEAEMIHRKLAHPQSASVVGYG